jgi:hypothetical protein
MEDFDQPTREPIRSRKRFHKRADQSRAPLPKCNGKNSFTTHQAAEKKRQRLLAVVPYLRIYKCTKCPYFHHTSQKPRP